MKAWKKTQRQRCRKWPWRRGNDRQLSHEAHRARIWLRRRKGSEAHQRLIRSLRALRDWVERHPELIGPCPKCHDMGHRVPVGEERRLPTSDPRRLTHDECPIHPRRDINCTSCISRVFCECLIGQAAQKWHESRRAPRYSEGLYPLPAPLLLPAKFEQEEDSP